MWRAIFGNLPPTRRSMGLAGTDDAGGRLCALLASSGIDTGGVQRDAGHSTTVKTRIIARNQQVVRVDRERPAVLTAAQVDAARDHLERAIADGGRHRRGGLRQGLPHPGRWPTTFAEAARVHGKMLTVDPHPHTSLVWRGATAIKPNRLEAFIAAGLPPAPTRWRRSPRIGALLEAGQRLLSAWRAGSLLITLGEQGMLLLEESMAAVSHPDARQRGLRRFGRGRYGHRGFHPRPGGGRFAARGGGAGQPRQRDRGGQTRHRHGNTVRTGSELRLRRCAPVFFDRDGTLMEEAHYCARPRAGTRLPGRSRGAAPPERRGLRASS